MSRGAILMTAKYMLKQWSELQQEFMTREVRTHIEAELIYAKWEKLNPHEEIIVKKTTIKIKDISKEFHKIAYAVERG